MEYKFTAIIIEPRKHKALEFVLRNALECLTEEWKIVLFHGTNNVEYSKAIQERLATPRLQLVELPVDNLNQMTYSYYLARPTVIYDYIDTEYFLVFQTDSLMIKENMFQLYYYISMGFDYVGAPWRQCGYFLTKPRDYIGNGGFSLRKTATMRKMMELHPYDPGDIWHEDLYFTLSREGVPLKKPSYERAKEFCVDEEYSERFLAVHRVWSHPHFHSIAQKYPEVQKLYELQGVDE